MTQVQKYYKSKYTSHSYIYWTRMYKVIHDLYWHSSMGIEFHSVIYIHIQKMTSSFLLFYVNSSFFRMTHLSCTIISSCVHLICILMKFPAVIFLVSLFDSDYLIFDEEHVEENNNRNYHRSINRDPMTAHLVIC
jgi:hypothetical protein